MGLSPISFDFGSVFLSDWKDVLNEESRVVATVPGMDLPLKIPDAIELKLVLALPALGVCWRYGLEWFPRKCAAVVEFVEGAITCVALSCWVEVVVNEPTAFVEPNNAGVLGFLNSVAISMAENSPDVLLIGRGPKFNGIGVLSSPVWRDTSLTRAYFDSTLSLL
jgi:hypothetical protein